MDSLVKIAAMALMLAAFICSGCGNRPVEPTTTLYVPVAPELRERLSPEIRGLLDDVEGKKAAGSLASNYAKVLSEANEIRRGKNSTWYIIYLDDADDREYHPDLFLFVDNKSGRIMKCGTTTSEW